MDQPVSEPTEKNTPPHAKAHLSLLQRPPREDGSDRMILLTGATGFVGGELLLRLMAKDRRGIICLVRGADAQEAAQRGQDRLRRLLNREPTPQETARIRWVRTDLEKSRLGLGSAEWKALADQAEEIFHCAASVDFDMPLADAQRINVDGVQELLELARAAGRNFRRFHHVSTAYVSGRTSERVTADHLPSDHARNFRNTYERTKARAERMLRAQKDVAVSIYRPSIIAGDTDSGRTDNWNVIYVPMRQMVTGRLPFLCSGGKGIADTVGVDFVVDGIVELAKRHDKKIQAYHLTADRQAFDLERYVRHCNKAASDAGLRGQTKLVSNASWTARTSAIRLLAFAPKPLARLRKIGEAASRGIQSFKPYLPYTNVSAEFEAGWEHHVLAKASIRMPDPDIYLERIIGYALEQNFGHSPKEVSKTQDAAAPKVSLQNQPIVTDRFAAVS